MSAPKTLGLIGGLTWISTVDYYSFLCEKMNAAVGGRFSPTIYLASVDLQIFANNMQQENWEGNAQLLSNAAQKLEQAGSDFIAMCSNTPHLFVKDVVRSVSIPIIDISECTAKEIARRKVKRVVLTGTKYTMAASFYRDMLENYGIEVVPLEAQDQEWVGATVFDELTRNIFLDSTREGYLRLFERMASLGVEGAILGCTEIPILLRGQDSPLALFDTMDIHCQAIMDFALNS